MLIENKATSIRYEISQEDWDNIVKLRYKNLYRIIDGTSTPTEIKAQKVEIPTVIREFQAVKKDEPKKKFTKPKK